jgi:UDP:flavonoid glycosyltransferase YjiC (YdhE family)
MSFLQRWVNAYTGSMKRVLFIPAQTGLAHIWRSQAVADELASNPGMQVQVLVERSKSELWQQRGRAEAVEFEAPVLADLALGQRLLRQDLRRAEIGALVDVYVNQICILKPDLVISDTELFGLTAAVAGGTPVGLIANALVLPWRTGLAGMVPNMVIRRVLGEVMASAGVERSKCSTVLETIPVLVPEWEGYSRWRGRRANMRLVGPIIAGVEQRDEEFERRVRLLSQGRPVVYLTFGGTGDSEAKFWELVAALVGGGYFVLASTGAIADVDRQGDYGGMAVIAKYMPGLSATALADCVVSHGSQGTITSALMTGRPVVAVPFNLDQQIHAAKLEELGVNLNTSRWRDGFSLTAPERVQRRAATVPAERVVAAVDGLLAHKEVARRLAAVRAAVGDLDGAKRAAKVVAQVLHQMQ